jgi:hypothetical protein
VIQYRIRGSLYEHRLSPRKEFLVLESIHNGLYVCFVRIKGYINVHIANIALYLVYTVYLFQDSPYPACSFLSGACGNIQSHNTGGVRYDLG